MIVKEIINVRQFTILIILATIGDAILVLPSLVVHLAQQDAWISTIIGLIFGLFIVYLYAIIARLFPQLSIIQANEQTFGKWIGAPISLFFLFYLFMSATTHIREFGDFMQAHILPLTPINITHLFFIFVIIFGLRLGLESITRTAELLFPLVFCLILILLFLSIPDIDASLIKPVFSNGIKPILLGSIPATAFPFMELAVFLMILPHINDQEQIKKAFFVGTIIGGIVLILTVVLCLLILGPTTTINTIYPSYLLAKFIQFDDTIQRIEGVIAILWTITVYVKISLYVYALHVGIAQFFKLKTYRSFTLPIGMIMFAGALIVAPNTSYFMEVILYDWPLYDITVAIIFPLLLVIVYWIRKPKGPTT